MDNLQLRQRIVRSMIRVSERTANMRKPEKFEYRKHMTAAFMDMLELCIEANRRLAPGRAPEQNGHQAGRAALSRRHSSFPGGSPNLSGAPRNMEQGAERNRAYARRLEKVERVKPVGNVSR